MRKIIKHILALTIIFITLLIIGIIYSITNTAKADQHPMFPPGTMKQTMSPIFCGSATAVYGHATNTFKQIPIAWADVKSKGDPNTPAIAWVSFWYSEETDSGSMFLTVVESGETCLMGYGMQWKFDTDALLDIVNKSFSEGNESTQ